MKLKAILAPGLLALAASDAVQAGTASDAYSAFQEALTKSDDLRTSLQRMDADPSSDGPAIYDYYSDRKKTYLAEPLKAWVNPAFRAAQEYTSAVTGAATTVATAAVSDSFKTEYVSCINQVPHYGELDSVASNFVSPVRSAATKLASPWKQGSSMPPDSNATMDTQMSSAAAILDSNWASSVNNCCRTAAAKDIAAGKGAPDALYGVCNQMFSDLNAKQNNFHAQLPDLVTQTPPNPLNLGTLKPYEIAGIIKDRTQLRQASSADAEENVFQKFQQTCEQKRLAAQNQSMPLKQGMILGVAKSLRCDILPSLGAAFGGLMVERLATGMARAPIAGKDAQGNNWDLNCDQNSLNALDLSRPSDPNIIAKTWGIDQLSNPPYIQSLRALPSLSPPFPITAVPTGGYLTPFGGIGLADPNKVTGFVNGPLAGLGAGSSGIANTGRQIAAQRGVARGMTRGVAQGSSLSLGARSLSSQITLGRSPLRAASVLHSGASNSRAFVSHLVANNAQVPPAQRRRNAVAAAAPVRAAVRSLASSKGSRVTSEGLLGSLAGRPLSGSANGVPGVVGAVASLQATADAQRAKIQAQATSYINNINLAIQKGEDVRLRIIQLAADRDLAIQQALNDMIGASPRKQSQRSQKLHTETMNMDKELALLKAQYDTYRASVLEESAMVQTLQLYGPKGVGYPALNNTGRNADTSASLGWHWKMTNLIQVLFGALDVYADNRVSPTWHNDKEWAEQWDKFLHEYAAHVDRKRAEESADLKSLTHLLQSRRDAIKLETVTDPNLDTLLTVDMYSRTIQEETSDLIRDQALKGRDAPNLDGNTLSLLRQARDDSEATLADLDKLALQYKESYPEQSDDNGESWWAVAPELILY